MVSFGEKAKIKKAGNLNKGRSYVITTVLQPFYELFHTFLTAINGSRGPRNSFIVIFA